MAVEADGHQLRHGLPFGEPLFHEDLQLHPAVKVVTAVWMSFESSPFTVMFVPET